ncbi:DUF808 domain-containing protein [Neisseria sp. Ec49-e6-T10]|uniref:DUF808 domain-containing protein n=1 Tax=Neisseria sp. Ec49-e6-T10 TaxID=3140744 RepID=UPI003EB6D429
MATGSLLALLDDIASVLDDVSLMTKVAAKKTAGVLGDDLALNAEQVSGVRANRELPVVWAVAKGSFMNKVILIPTALLISFYVNWLITPLLMVGGAFLCYEGFEKLAHKFLHKPDDQAKHESEIALENEHLDLVSFEKDKIKGAIRTDFVLSAEIIVISLGTVQGQSILMQTAVIALIGVIMTVGVYGLVAGIVKLDDVGFYLMRKTNMLAKKIGAILVNTTPYLMRFLTVVGTIAMFMVGGGILTHGIHIVSDFFNQIAQGLTNIPILGGLLAALTPSILNAVFGVLAGAVILLIMTPLTRIFKPKNTPA